MRRGDTDQRAVQIVEGLVGDDRDDFGAPAAQARVFLDGEQAAGSWRPMRESSAYRAAPASARRSTSQSMPWSARRRLGRSRARAAPSSASATMVRSLPGRDDLGGAQVSRISPSGTSPFGVYSDLCSKKITGSGSRTAAASRPMTSTGEDGAATLRPGIIMHQFSTDWECCAPKREPAPLAVRTTSGRVGLAVRTYSAAFGNSLAM